MPHCKQIAELEFKIENLRSAIESLRTSCATRADIDRALSELARVKAERLRLMLRHVNVRTEQLRDQAPTASGPKHRDAETVRLSDAD